MNRPALALLLACLLIMVVPEASADGNEAAAESFSGICREQAEQAREAERLVVAGADNWLFLTAELRHLGAGRFWGEAAQTASTASREDARDPLPIIVDTARQLREAGVALLLVPVPPRAIVYAEHLWPEVPRDEAGRPQRLDQMLAEFHALLRAEGIAVLDLTEALLAARATDDADGPIYCRQDSHWSSCGAEVAAAQIVAWLREHELAPPQRLQAKVESVPSELSGDLWQLLDKADEPREQLPVRRVSGPDGEPPGLDSQSSILLLADSHGLVFHAGGDMHAAGGGVSDHLAAALGSPVNMIARRGSAATAVRIDLARRIRADAAFAGQLKVVIWCYAAREYTESAGWRPVPIFP